MPIYGFNCDNYLKCEYVVPATELSQMEGGTISSLTWYLQTPATGSWGHGQFPGVRQGGLYNHVERL
ncbi:MAG: hypothetical protein IJT30_02135 [Muribaculaceae bacterium]|nr:hypothetical protein [Muribaculaceae bacterium]